MRLLNRAKALALLSAGLGALCLTTGGLAGLTGLFPQLWVLWLWVWGPAFVVSWLGLWVVSIRLRGLAWQIERLNPQLGENLISWVELRGRVREEVLERLEQRVSRANVKLTGLVKPKSSLVAVFLMGAQLLFLRVGLDPWAFLPGSRSKAFILPESPVFFVDQPPSIRLISGHDLSNTTLLFCGPDTTTIKPGPGHESSVRPSGLEAGSYTVSLLSSSNDTLARVALTGVRRPFITDIQAFLQDPGAGSDTLHQPAVITAHQGARLRLRVKHTGDTVLVFDSRGKALDLDMRLEKDMVIEFVLMKKGLRAKSAKSIEISVVPDNPPTVRLVRPSKDILLPKDEIVPVIAQAEDDIGLRALTVFWRFRDSTRSLRLPIKPGSITGSGSGKATLRGMGMYPGDQALIWAQAVDTRGQVSTSPVIRVRFPSMQEIFSQTEQSSQEISGAASQMQSKAGQLEQQLEQIDQMLKSSNRLSWEEKQQIQRSIQAGQQLSQELKQLSQQADQEFQRLADLPNYDPELLEKFAQAQKALEELMTDDMREAIQQLQQALSRLDPKEVQRALEQLRQNTQKLNENLQRTAELLKRFAQEAKLQRLAHQAEQLAQQQGDLAEQLEKQGPSQDIIQKQEQLSREISDLKKEVDSLAQELAQQKEPESQQLQDISEKHITQAHKSASDATQKMSSSLTSQALTSQREAGQQLRQTASALSSLGQQMTQRRKQEIAKAIAKARQEVIFIGSQLHQENLDPADLDALARATKTAREELENLGSKTALIPSSVLALLSAGQRVLEFGARGQTVRLDRARADLNLAALQLFDVQQQASSCSGTSTGMAQAMKKLAQMAQAQAQLNQGTRNLLDMMASGQISPQQAGQRLLAMAAQQEALRRQLEALRASMQDQGNNQAAGALEGAEKAMQEAEQAMKKGALDQELLKKQQNIYNRMLQAQQSMNKQEFSPKRQSETGKAYIPQAPESSPKQELRRSLLEASKQQQLWKYPPEYQKLIKAYYRTLLQQ